MDRFKNILVAASPGHLEASVLRAAVDLADTNRAELTILDVVEPVPRMRRITRVRRRTVDVQAERVGERIDRLNALARDTRAGDGTDVKVVVGRPVIEVIRHVLEHDNDLVIVGGSGVEGRETAELPTGVTHLLRKCPVPVWVMRPSESGNSGILALVDPDVDDPARDSLNGLVLALATSLARRDHGNLYVGHALEPSGGAPPQSEPHLGSPGEGAAPGASDDGDRERLGALLERHRVAELGAEVHLVTGHAGEALPKLADGLRAELIVMGTVARTGISGLIIGNTAETILRSARCSVLAVKPNGFVAPVRPAMAMAA